MDLCVIMILVALTIGGVVIYRRSMANELLQEAAEVFAYTAELLAAEIIRETIFTCYQNLCTVLQQNGFLRRDFETVREFEVAIRQAMPEISMKLYWHWIICSRWQDTVEKN